MLFYGCSNPRGFVCEFYFFISEKLRSKKLFNNKNYQTVFK